MLRDNLVELIEPMLNSAGADPLALYIHNRTQASDDRLPCLKNPRPEGAEPSLTESSSSPFQAEPAQKQEGKTVKVTNLVRHHRGWVRFHLSVGGFVVKNCRWHAPTGRIFFPLRY